MNGKKILFFCALLVVFCLLLLGCGKKAVSVDETTPLSEVKAQAEKMTVQQLREMATKYKNAITVAIADKDKLEASVKNLSAEEMLKKVEALKADIDKIESKVSALKERLQVYLDELKKKGESITGLEI